MYDIGQPLFVRMSHLQAATTWYGIKKSTFQLSDRTIHQSGETSLLEDRDHSEWSLHFGLRQRNSMDYKLYLSRLVLIYIEKLKWRRNSVLVSSRRYNTTVFSMVILATQLCLRLLERWVYLSALYRYDRTTWQWSRVASLTRFHSRMARHQRYQAQGSGGRQDGSID